MTKEILLSYNSLLKEIERLNEKIKELESSTIRSYRMSDILYDKNRSNPQEVRLLLIEKYLDLLEEKRIESLEQVIRIEGYISAIDDLDTKAIFTKRYIEMKEWNQIAKEMFMSRSLVFLKHKKYLSK